MVLPPSRSPFAREQAVRAAPPPRNLPPVTSLVVALNVGVWLAMIATGTSPVDPDIESLVRWGANVGALTLHGEVWRLFAACWLHGGIIHLALNMYVLWDLGRLSEGAFGAAGFFLVYVVAGLGGSLASTLVHPDVVSVGASGAVFGTAGAFLAFLLRNRGRLHPAVASALRRSLLTFVLLNLVIGMSIPQIDQSAHVGGLLTGFVAGLIAAPLITLDGPSRPYARYPILIVIAGLMLTAPLFPQLALAP